MVINKIEEEIVNKKKLFNLNVDLSHERPEILAICDGNDLSLKFKQISPDI